MAYQPAITEGPDNQKRNAVSDASLHDLLEMIFRELRIMNLHLSSMTDISTDNEGDF